MKDLDFKNRGFFFQNLGLQLTKEKISPFLKELTERLDDLQPYVSGGFLVYNNSESKCQYASQKIPEILGGYSRKEYDDLAFDHRFDHIHPSDLSYVLQFQTKAHAFMKNILPELRKTIDMCCAYRDSNGDWFYCKTVPLLFSDTGDLLFSYEYLDPIMYPYKNDIPWWKVSVINKDDAEEFIESDVHEETEIVKTILTKTEKRIGEQLLLNKTSQSIADELHISKHTVDTHRKNIKKKLCASSNENFLDKLREINE